VTTLASILACGLCLLVLSIALLGAEFLHRLWKYETLSIGDHAPKVDIIMPLRGPDPFLRRCLIALTKQNYPDYVIHIVVDHKDDPVHTLVEEVIAETGTTRVKFEVLNNFSETCSLRMSALLQAVRNLPDDREVFVTVDADANPNSEWLNDLMAGMQDPQVGVACGLRWYSSTDKSLINLARHVWNAGALLQMVYQDVGWGGSIAYRREAFNQADISSHWGQALFDDTLASDRILKAGYRLQVLPRVTMVNEESTDLKGCLLFISRQLLNVRLYHSSWNWIFSYCMLTAGWTIASLVTLITALVIQNWTAAAIIGGGLASYILAQSIQMTIAESVINGIQVRQGKPGIEFTRWRLPLAVIAALTIYPIAAWHAYRTQSVTWRGITYNFNGPFSVKRLNYQPFQLASTAPNKSL
jgi:cellulose synthase/poly-beta-1,6-N-acetylglucosamine synthase-like glycosyltransferase